MTTTSHETPTPSAKIMELRGLVAWQTAKTMWQCDYGQSGQHHVFEDWWMKQSMIDWATEDAIAPNRSIREHDEKLHKMELTWCQEKPGLFPTHIRTTFATVRSRLEAHDVRWAGQTQTATEYEMADFEGSREGEDKEGWREEREEAGKKREGKEEEKREEEEDRAREEGDKQVLDNTNDVVMTSRSTDHLSTTTNDRILVFPRLGSICHNSIWISANYIQLSLFNGQLGLSCISKVTGVKSLNQLTKGDLSQLKPTEAARWYRNGDYWNEAERQYYTTRTNTFACTYTTMSTGIGVHGTNKSKSM